MPTVYRSNLLSVLLLLVSLANIAFFVYNVVHSQKNGASRDEPRDSICGVWQGSYQRVHDQIITAQRRNNPEAKFAVVSFNNGRFAERLSATVSVFMYALLTRRAFQIDWNDNHNLIAAYEAPNINWAYTNFSSHHRLVSDNYGCSSAEEPRGPRCGTYHVTVEFDLRTDPFNETTVTFLTRKGSTFDAMGNPYIFPDLLATGLRPETVFGCLFNFLFKPSKGVRVLFQEEFRRLSDSSVLKIGIHIATRNGSTHDPLIEEIGHTHVVMEGAFRCAEEIETTRASPFQKVIWFVVSDAARVRAQAVERYGQKVLTRTGAAATEHFHGRNARGESGVMVAAGENWLLGMCDVFVLTEGDSFGQTAAFRSLQWHSMYVVPRNKSCGPAEWNPEREVSRMGAGI